MRLGKGWRKREGIEPPGDIAASRPDLKSGGATSAPSASVRVISAATAGEPGPCAPPVRGTACLLLFRFFPAALHRLFLSLSAAPNFPLPFRRHFRSVAFPSGDRAGIITESHGGTMRRLLPLLPALLLISFSSPAMALPGFEAGVRGMYWFPDLAATAQTTTAGITETKFDVKNDLRVGDENFPSGEAFLRFGRVTFRLGYTPIRFDGNKNLTDNVTFNGQTFTATTNVISRLDIDMLDADLQVDIFRHDLIAAGFYLGLIAKVKYVDGEVELKSPVLTEKRDFKAPIPMIGLAAGAGFANNLVRVDARVTGMAYSGNHLYEADAFASLCPFPFFRIQGGYRYIDLKVDEDDIVADLELKGPYVGAQLSF